MEPHAVLPQQPQPEPNRSVDSSDDMHAQRAVNEEQVEERDGHTTDSQPSFDQELERAERQDTRDVAEPVENTSNNDTALNDSAAPTTLTKAATAEPRETTKSAPSAKRGLAQLRSVLSALKKGKKSSSAKAGKVPTDAAKLMTKVDGTAHKLMQTKINEALSRPSQLRKPIDPRAAAKATTESTKGQRLTTQATQKGVAAKQRTSQQTYRNLRSLGQAIGGAKRNSGAKNSDNVKRVQPTSLTEMVQETAEELTQQMAPTNRLKMPRGIARPTTKQADSAQANTNANTSNEMNSSMQSTVPELTNKTTQAATTIKSADAPQQAKDVQALHQRVLDHVDTLRMDAAKNQTKITVRLGKLGSVQVQVQMNNAQQSGQTGRLEVVMQATEVQTASMLKNGLTNLAEALEAKGYQSPTIEVRDSSASDTNTNRRDANSQQNQHREQWEEAQDNEAFSAAMGRRHGDREQDSNVNGGNIQWK